MIVYPVGRRITAAAAAAVFLLLADNISVSSAANHHAAAVPRRSQTFNRNHKMAFVGPCSSGKIQGRLPSVFPSATASTNSLVTSPSRTNRHGDPPTFLGQTTTKLRMSNDSDEPSPLNSVVTTIGWVAQPVVWISLYLVATTGGGLPAGPNGVLGALEGISYLVVVKYAALGIESLWKQPTASSTTSSASTTKSFLSQPPQQISLFTIALGIAVLLKLIGDQGCVPNAKPILDYSQYVKVCNPDDGTPGLFGG